MCQGTVQMSDVGLGIFRAILLLELCLISHSKKALIIKMKEKHEEVYFSALFLQLYLHFLLF